MIKKEDAKRKTMTALLKVAREHFTQEGYHDASLEKIAEEAHVTRGAVYHHFKNKLGLFLAVLELVQQDVAAMIEEEAITSEDLWEQLILGSWGFIKAANKDECRRILLVDAPGVVGWEAWRRVDQENSQSVLKSHIDLLQQKGCLAEDVDTTLMAIALSGALNELALNYSIQDPTDLLATIRRLVDGFKAT
ncbi:TetR family transcriptional regulator [Enterococcus florum]|uniref:TetR family transcriptional regulator n=1 Tax=Enterococcus florum TaxID=2480627 RepID=A0A4P5P8E2_9ENTE|nr:TetR/AcrR family transcriptional regulator [Enterococcus florum]GCF93796.1 TetR family transcriptional regulator [Enterococcus florum]